MKAVITLAIILSWFGLFWRSALPPRLTPSVNTHTARILAGWTGPAEPANPPTAWPSAPIFVSGYIFVANVGWINLGNGAPADCTQYSQTNYPNNVVDFGVNVYNTAGTSYLSGYGYGANIGWVTFEQTYGKPSIQGGAFSGNVWSANCGWISLSNAAIYLQTDIISSGAPTLYISYSDSPNSVTVYWQACPTWILEQNDVLSFTTGWTPSSGVFTLNNTNYLNITPPTGNLYFRLSNP